MKVNQREWLRKDFHYDNVFFSFLTLFVISTGEGWPQVLWDSIEATEENKVGFRVVKPQNKKRGDFETATRALSKTTTSQFPSFTLSSLLFFRFSS